MFIFPLPFDQTAYVRFINCLQMERIRHSEELEDNDYIINPLCVAAMPEEIRKGFLKKVFGITLVDPTFEVGQC